MLESVVKGKSIPTLPEVFWNKYKSKLSKPDKNGCILWRGYRAKNGYGHTYFKGKSYLVHRLAYLLYYGELDPNYQINHNDGCPKHCCNPKHLYKGSARQNSNDSKRTGKLNSLSQEIKDKVYQDSQLGLSYRKIAHKYSIAPSTVERVLKPIINSSISLPRWIHEYAPNKYKYQFNNNGKCYYKHSFKTIEEALEALQLKRKSLNID